MKEIIVKAALTLVSHPNPIYSVLSYYDSQLKITNGSGGPIKCLSALMRTNELSFYS